MLNCFILKVSSSGQKQIWKPFSTEGHTIPTQTQKCKDKDYQSHTHKRTGSLHNNVYTSYTYSHGHSN